MVKQPLRWPLKPFKLGLLFQLDIGALMTPTALLSSPVGVFLWGYGLVNIQPSKLLV
jgi:hypothetical protein